MESSARNSSARNASAWQLLGPRSLGPQLPGLPWLPATRHRRSFPLHMRGVEITQPGGPEVLKLGVRANPTPSAGEVLIRVGAAGVNRPDTMQRKGAYPPPPGASDIPGLEVAGTVIALGAGVREPAVGADVCA